ncbi:MAG: hypothetical protein LBS57_07450, partial [Treponema sp.]|nr:hypothetical protein [Treponema sp.]
RSHLAKYAKDASDIRQAVKSPAALRAEAMAVAGEERQVVNGDPVPAPASTLTLVPSKPAKRKIRGIFDVD